MRLVVVPWLPSLKRNWTTYAVTIAPFVFIRKDKKDDPAILAHEEVHLRQAKVMGWWLFYWNYATNLGFRASIEAEGYAKQKEVERT